MGKPKSLKSSMKTIQEAICFNSVAPICLQQSRTTSFREDLYDRHNSESFRSVYYTPSFASPSHSLSISAAAAAVGDDSGNASSSSSSVNGDGEDIVPTGPMNSRRFFFSPMTTKLIMEENKSFARASTPHRRIKSAGDKSERRLPVGASAASSSSSSSCFCDWNLRVVMSSYNPYGDFRTSMEEMVEAHGVRDCLELKKLLHCYLSLNDEKTHNAIMLAFVDILLNFPSSPPENGRRSFSSFHALLLFLISASTE